MNNSPIKKRIPTILGIFILFVGVVSGVLLTKAPQILRIGAKVDIYPKNIRVSNITDSQFTISFVTDENLNSSVKIGEDKFFLSKTSTQTSSGKRVSHYYNFRNLSPQKMYYVSIIINGTNYPKDTPLEVQTGKEIGSEKESQVIYGKIFSKSGEEQPDALIYAQVGNGSLVSTISSDNGSWFLPTSKTRTSDLASYEEVDEKLTEIQLFVIYGQTSSSVTTHIENARPMPPIVLGKNLDLRNTQIPPTFDNLPTPDVFGVHTDKAFPFLLRNIYKEPSFKFYE